MIRVVIEIGKRRRSSGGAILLGPALPTDGLWFPDWPDQEPNVKATAHESETK